MDIAQKGGYSVSKQYKHEAKPAIQKHVR
jgi:hypothetical protein